MNEMLLELAKQAGIAGTVLSIAFVYIWRLHKDLEHTQEQRVKDSQAQVDKLLEWNNKWHALLQERIEMDNENWKSLEDVKDMVLELYTEAKR